jgi:hypothetical protein
MNIHLYWGNQGTSMGVDAFQTGGVQASGIANVVACSASLRIMLTGYVNPRPPKTIPRPPNTSDA